MHIFFKDFLSLIPHKKTKHSQVTCFQVSNFIYFHNEMRRGVGLGLGKEYPSVFTWLEYPYRWCFMQRCHHISHFQTLKSTISCNPRTHVWTKTRLVIMWSDVEKEIVLEDFLQLSHFSHKIGKRYNEGICFSLHRTWLVTWRRSFPITSRKSWWASCTHRPPTMPTSSGTPWR